MSEDPNGERPGPSIGKAVGAFLLLALLIVAVVIPAALVGLLLLASMLSAGAS